MSEQLFFVVPAYNEAENLPHLLANLARIERFFDTRATIIVVNDGSTDNTLCLLKEYERDMRLLVLTHSQNSGPGKAFDTGFRRVLAEAGDDDVVVSIEADNTSDLCVLGRMIDRLNRGHDVVLASVYGNGKIVGAPLSRRLLSFAANGVMKLAFRIPEINTFTSFFRAYRCSALRALYDHYGDQAIQEKGFTCMLEILLKFHRMRLNLAQVPVLLDGKMRIGESRMKVVRNIEATLALIWRYLFTDSFEPKREHSYPVERQPAGIAEK
jgi:dolichol-phosphate mannosyltransferase